MDKVLSAELNSMWNITVKLAKTNYGGLCKGFELRSNNGVIPLKIVGVKELIDCFEYEVTYQTIDFGIEYTLVDEHGLIAPLEFKYITHDPKFVELFKYEGDDLGPTYSKDATIFKVFAPTAPSVLLEIELKGETTIHPMCREKDGVHCLILKGDYELASYLYLVKINGKYETAIDPYAYSSTPNHTRSVVIDLNKTEVERSTDLKPLKENVDAIIYELSIRDFSVDSNVDFKNRAKYLAFLEEGLKTKKGNAVGLDYLTSLGVTHIQILPFYDFGSVDELNQFNSYNWGYDPVQYGVPEGSYANDVNNPYSRVIECKQMIEKLHEKGLRINMDIVFNHVFDRFTSSFEKIVPYYYFKMDKNGNLSNGSFCSNDFDSTQYMAQKYIIDILKRWVVFYNVDGFRFDLMGIIDIQTINKVAAMAKKHKPDFMLYGEGWNMPCLMDDRLKAIQTNNAKLPMVGFFSDRYRDTIKGSTNESEIMKKGYCTGDYSYLDVVKDVMTASCLPSYFDYSYLSANNVVNYVECHDNHTLYDKLARCCSNESLDLRKKRQRLINALVILTPGIPFIHAGQEFFRTKNGDYNSYMSSDEINKIDWHLIDKNIESIKYLKNIIDLRMTNPIFRKYRQDDIRKNIKPSFAAKNVLKVIFTSETEEYVMYVNPNSFTVEEELIGQYQIILNDFALASDQSVTKLYLNPVSLIIIKRK